jgi:hypothetical protein
MKFSHVTWLLAKHSSSADWLQAEQQQQPSVSVPFSVLQIVVHQVEFTGFCHRSPPAGRQRG